MACISSVMIQNCVHQHRCVCIKLCGWWTSCEPPVTYHRHTDGISVMKEGRGGFELLPSRNKCYIPYLSQMLSCKCISVRAVIRREASWGRLLRGRNQPEEQAHLQVGAIPHHLFPRLVLSPEEDVHCGDSCRLIKSESPAQGPGKWTADGSHQASLGITHLL